MTIGGAVLQNQLHKRLPAAFTAQLQEGVALAYSAIPAIGGLQDPLQSEVREAFAQSIIVIWQVMIGIAGIGLLSTLLMKALPLHTQVDERWGLENNIRQSVQTDEVPMRTRGGTPVSPPTTPPPAASA